MKKWIAGFFALCLWSTAMALPRTIELDQSTLQEQPVDVLSANFVDRVIHDLPVEKHLEIFRDLDPDELEKALNTQQKQLTFWINIYNGYTQYFLKTDPSLYQEDRSDFFKKEQIDIAGYSVSMEDIEHGVLRRGAVVISFGFIRNLSLRKPFIQRYAVNEVDYRIHFALNCGAKSCPPVVAYQTEWVDRQLNDSSRDYLQFHVDYRPDDNRVYVPRLMSWFKADFGSDDDQRAILKKFGVIPNDKNPRIKFLEYDWTMQIENYRAYTYE
ncbi:hypothetical protein FHR99_003015 [Litorivivens lipolytica]|uniref:DUF547 domain-containing protein n=1 Tax=Litorivivens lipolytica TaxID=1524264 RepID=A0A7W4W776_9GAMM|nr:hypothetical protein [Litorivivens lipolytica]